MNSSLSPKQEPSSAETASIKAKRRAAGAMLFVSISAILLLSSGYLDAVQHDEVKSRFLIKPIATRFSESWRQKAGLFGAFALFLVPIVRNVALFRLPHASLRKWAVASTMMWLSIVLWRSAFLLF